MTCRDAEICNYVKKTHNERIYLWNEPPTSGNFSITNPNEHRGCENEQKLHLDPHFWTLAAALSAFTLNANLCGTVLSLSLYLSLSSVLLSFFLSRSASCCLCFICLFSWLQLLPMRWREVSLLLALSLLSYLLLSFPTFPSLLGFFHVSHKCAQIQGCKMFPIRSNCKWTFSRVLKFFLLCVLAWILSTWHWRFLWTWWETYTHTNTHSSVFGHVWVTCVCGCVHRGAVWREAGFLCSWTEPMSTWLKVHSNPPGIQVSPLTRCWDLCASLSVYILMEARLDISEDLRTFVLVLQTLIVGLKVETCYLVQVGLGGIMMSTNQTLKYKCVLQMWVSSRIRWRSLWAGL